MEEKILEILKVSRNNGLSKQEVYKKLAYTNLSFEDFEEVFDDLQTRQEIYQTGKDKYTLNPFKEAEIQITRKGLILAKTDKDTYEISEDQFNCLTGDKVKIRITDFNQKKGTIKEVLTRKGTPAEVKIENGKKYAIVRNKENETKYELKTDENLVDGILIGIKLEKNRKDKQPVATLDRIFGHKNKPRLDEEIILYENNFNYEWPEEVKKEIKYTHKFYRKGMIKMKIAIINENSQVTKNKIIYDALKPIADKKGYEIYNYGMENPDEENLTYVQAGLLSAILINSKAVDFIITGCGTGEGAMLALNSFPNVLCGHIEDPTDAYLFSQINAGNAVAIGYAKGFGWGSELTLTYIFEKLFESDFGGGYPRERVVPEQANKKILDEVKKITHKDMMAILREIDQEFLYQTVNRNQFKKYFFENAEDGEIKEYIRKILQK